MRLGLKLVRKKPVRASARGSGQSGLIASAAVPDSGFAFVHNSQGASAALSELSGKLSGVLELIDLDGRSPCRARLPAILDGVHEFVAESGDR